MSNWFGLVSWCFGVFLDLKKLNIGWFFVEVKKVI